MRDTTEHLLDAAIAISNARHCSDCQTDLQHTLLALHSDIQHSEGCSMLETVGLIVERKKQQESPTPKQGAGE